MNIPNNPALKCFLLFACLISTSMTVAEEATLAPLRYDLGGTSGWVPYGYLGDPEEPGILGELVAAIMQQAKIPFLPFYYPPKRAEKALSEGQLDFDFVSPKWFKDEDVGDQFVATHSLISVSEYFVTLPENADDFPTPDSPYGYSVGTVSGYFYYDDDKFERVDFLSESELILGLQKGRFKIAILAKLAASYWSKQHDITIAFPSLHTTGNLIIRLRKEHQELLPRINAAIDYLHETGQVDEILKRYNIQ